MTGLTQLHITKWSIFQLFHHALNIFPSKEVITLLLGCCMRGHFIRLVLEIYYSDAWILKYQAFLT